MLGTCSAVAVVAARQGHCAVAVFRQDYARRGLVGRCLDPAQEPLISFSAQQLEHALALSVSIVEAQKPDLDRCYTIYPYMLYTLCYMIYGSFGTYFRIR